jgi:predicted Zn finger-like uncharacterized protein
MLFTRCPDCDTTFRVTDDALKKANGQVRCGRCASVFNAYAELHESGMPPGTRRNEPAAEPPVAPPAVPPPVATGDPDEGAEATTAAAEPAPPPLPPPPAPTLTPLLPTAIALNAAKSAAVDGAAASIGATSVADVFAQVEISAADENAVTGELDLRSELANEQPISAEQVDDVLAVEPSAYGSDAPQWTLLDEPKPKRTNRRWSIAAVFALLTLGSQVVHHYRAELAGHELLGPWVQQGYAALGVTVTPSWDVHQYEILDWVATAEPNERGLGSLKITARIQNHGPVRQPYPAVQLRLKDRWEEAVGSRTFMPAEYLSRDTPRGRLMSPGETARAEIEVVDPGPDAYGFELDVCVEVEANTLSCGADKVFL